MILVVDNYDSFTFNLVQAIQSLGAEVEVHRNDEISVDDVRALKPDAVVLSFAGGTAIRLEGSEITCRVEDMGEPWPTTWRPQHPLGETA